MYRFKWQDLGNIENGRPNLGKNTPVAVYRLMQYTMRSVLFEQFGPAEASQLFYKAGELAGVEFCKNLLDTSLGIDAFLADLQRCMKEFEIGILRVEETGVDGSNFVLVIAEDLDCSGLPPTGETVCEYDEGFLAGVMSTYLNRKVMAKEIDCWAKGDRVCRFRLT
ncbi:MAG: 4-vinyl reductase [Lentimicrobium sp.]|nr:4-vinyl reductase [Lentimicrobium sp.]